MWRLAAVALLLLAVWPVGAWAAARLLIVREPISRVEAIVILSGSATYRERARHAAALYNEGRAERIILTNDNLRSGWSVPAQRNLFYHELAKQELQSRGVPADKIEIIMIPTRGTYDEALKLKEYSEKHGLASFIVVTSAYHSRRALWTFRRVFRDTTKQIGIDPADTGLQTPPPSTWWLHRFGWTLVPSEYVKLAGYRFSVE